MTAKKENGPGGIRGRFLHYLNAYFRPLGSFLHEAQIE